LVSGTSESHVPRLQEEIGVGFGLQGRTIEISDQFDDAVHAVLAAILPA